MYADEQTLELSQVRLQTKASLRFTQRCAGEVPWFMVEDEATGKSFKSGFLNTLFFPCSMAIAV